MKLVIFYFMITFLYTKYYVHSYTVDAVFTLSYIVVQSHTTNLRKRHNLTTDRIPKLKDNHHIGTDCTKMVS